MGHDSHVDLCPPGAATPAGTVLPMIDPERCEGGAKRVVTAELVKVLLHRRHDRGMRVEAYTSRCVRVGELHELVTTDQVSATAGSRVDRVGFLGFAEVGRAGVIDRGDQVWIDDRSVGTVLGFDACHFPNHYNILIASPRLLTGGELALAPEQSVRFTPSTLSGPPPAVPGDGPGATGGGAGAAEPARTR